MVEIPSRQQTTSLPVSGRSDLCLGLAVGHRGRCNRVALVIPLTIAALAAAAQVVVGDWATREVAEDRPVKLAALEGLGEIGEVKYGLEIPRRLLLPAFYDPNARVPDGAG